MDLIVSRALEGNAWDLTDLLGRPAARVIRTEPARFMIEPNQAESEAMARVPRGPHSSLDAALADIERHTRGVCRHMPEPNSG